jgi:hypothetical protein
VTVLLEDLDSEVFAVREKAMRELDQLGRPAEPILRRKLQEPHSQEFGRRAEQLLRRWKDLEDPLPKSELLRALRAVEVLEQVGRRESRQVLQRLAGGAPDARLTQEAKASLDRLAKRTATKP